MLTGDKAHTINVDMSISNELFQPDYAFIPLDPSLDQSKGPPPASLNMIEATGEMRVNLPFHNLVRKSVAVIDITQQGTQLIYLQQRPVEFRMYQTEEGKKARAWGLHSPLPETAKNVEAYRMKSNLMSWVSRNGLTTPKTLNKGLEIAAGSHPNDLFVTETSRFQLHLNGKPLKQPIELAVLQGNTRYRNDRKIKKVVSDDNGWFSFTWQQAGVYLIEAELDLNADNDGIITRHALFVTLEVNPQ